MKEEAVPSEACELIVNCCGAGPEDPRDLAVGSAGNGVFLDLDEEFGFLEPIGDAEGLIGEGASAGFTAVTLDDMRRLASVEAAVADDGPGRGLGIVVLAVRIGAVGRK
jgi:hypothetical protein